MCRLKYILMSMAFVVSACGTEGSEVAKPPARALTDDALGYFCGMTVSNHDGPKGQIFLKGQKDPIWFVSVKDTLAFTRLPEESHKVQAVYVTDMGVAQNWDQPEGDSWRDADDLWFVVGSKVIGGMGNSEIVPFADKNKAKEFAAINKGKLLKMTDIDTDTLLGDSQVTMSQERM